jgi:hypothetical protein
MTTTRLYVFAAAATIATTVLLNFTPIALAGTYPSSGKSTTHGPLPSGPNAVDNPGGGVGTKGNPGGHGRPTGSDGGGGRPGSGSSGGRPGT